MTPRHRTCLLAFLFAILAGPASAQRQVPPSPVPDDWSHGTTLSAIGGLATDMSDPGAAAGGAIGWELAPRVAIEGSALWLDDAAGADGFNAALKVRAGLREAGVSPFVEGGIGLYHVSTTAGPETMPAFYKSRMISSANGTTMTQSFTDPSFHIGAGINVFVSRHIALQPAVEAMIVTADSQSYTLTAVTIRIAYHFEDHPVTSSR
jgi:opacity protein-like surface antigen